MFIDRNRLSATHRPGILNGPYPQRREDPPNWLELALARGVEHATNIQAFRASRGRQFVQRVEGEAAQLRGLARAVFAERVRALRRQLLLYGLSEPLVARSFASIRHLARRTLGMRHFDVQLIGGWIMVNGLLAEMDTGEGKTLTATLPAATAALAGIPVHLVTANDYLVRRDAAAMRPLYAALGLTLGTVTEDMDLAARRAAYACDITYCTGKQLAFDYLRDRLVMGETTGRLQLSLERLQGRAARINRLLLRGLCFAIVDEADSVLIDDARTPLIISQTGDRSAEQELYRKALAFAAQLQSAQDFVIDSRERRVDLTSRGMQRLAELASSATGVWSNCQRREELLRQALAARNLFHRDKHYLVRQGKVEIVDEYTGRVLADRSWGSGLHQMIETKEGCELTANRETLAQTSFQRFFRRYLRLAGMTGTAREVAAELRRVYGLHVVRVPPNRPSRRVANSPSVYPTRKLKWRAIVMRVAKIHRTQRPVLVGTRSVADSEYLSTLLSAVGLSHRVLNARQDRHEAEIIARAGQRGQITLATNMAGRGTDIRLEQGIAALGGLHVIASERHDARRIDRQLFGRCGRQGDPGSFETILSLEDELAQRFLPPLVHRLVTRVYASNAIEYVGRHFDRIGIRASKPGPTLPSASNKKTVVDQGIGQIGALLLNIAQRLAERDHRRVRQDLMKLNDRLTSRLGFAGRRE